MTRALALSLLVAALALLGGSSGRAPTAAAADRSQVVVLLRSPSLAVAGGAGAARRIDDEQRRFEKALRSRIPSATVHWRYRIVANGVSVVLPSRDLPRLAGLPGVREVFAPATYRALAGPDAVTIRARELPAADIPNAGAGIKIGIIDDGVDQRHPFFDPAGYEMPSGYPRGQAAYTTAKVIVARAFPPPGATWRHASKPFDPEQSSHGTHVAGIAAGNRDTLAAGTRISGIAPRAYIGNYKVLTVPTDANVGLDGNAPEIVAAIEAAVTDGMDVINLSIGEPEIEPSRDVVALALDAAAAAGVVPVVAAGNDFDDYGPGSLSSPGSSTRAITVGASTSGTAPGIASFSSVRPHAGLAPAQARLRGPGHVDPLGRARRVGDVVGDEHGRTPRLGCRRAAAPAASGVDAGPGEGGPQRHCAARLGRRRRLAHDACRRRAGRRRGRRPAARPSDPDRGLVRARGREHDAEQRRDARRRGRRRRARGRRRSSRSQLRPERPRPSHPRSSSPAR